LIVLPLIVLLLMTTLLLLVLHVSISYVFVHLSQTSGVGQETHAEMLQWNQLASQFSAELTRSREENKMLRHHNHHLQVLSHLLCKWCLSFCFPFACTSSGCPLVLCYGNFTVAGFVVYLTTRISRSTSYKVRATHEQHQDLQPTSILSQID
jgi:hypothetical protein